MKIFTNITREYLGGITTTNNALLSFLIIDKNEIVGLEFDTVRCMKGPIILQKLDPRFFEHYILNIHDLPFKKIINTAKNLNDIKKYYLSAIKDIKDLMRKTSPNVILLNGTSYFPWLISIAAHELKIPIVLRYHGIYSVEMQYLHKKANEIILGIEKSFEKTVTAFIFPSNLCKNIVEKEIFKKQIKNGYVIPNPVQVPKISSRSLAKRKIAMVARWLAIKNIDVFFQLHKILNEQGWKHSATFINEKANTEMIPKTIKQLTPMRYEELCDFYKSQGLIVAPAYFETFGNVPMEAVCMGIPVLVSNNMGCAEILIAVGLEKMVIDFSDLAKVASRVKELCGQKILPKQLNALKKILDNRLINTEINNVLINTSKKVVNG